MDFPIKVNCFIIFILCSFLSCEAKDWLCPVETSNKSVHEYICKTIKAASDDILSKNNCHLISDDINLPTNNSEVIELKFKHCDFNLIASYLNVYGNVTSLDISNSKYDSLNSLNLNNNILSKFNASHNKLADVPQNIFDNTPAISEVDFSHNNIKVFKLSTSKVLTGPPTMQKLNAVHLELNPISWIPTVPHAKSVHFSWRNIKIIDTNRLDKRLQIVPNSLDEGYFKTSSECSEFRCNKDSFTNAKVFSIEGKIRNFNDLFRCFGPSSTIETLHLSRNVIRDVNLTEFARFSMLNELYLSDTQLESFDFAILKDKPNLNFLDISDNRFKAIKNTQILEQVKSLKTFNISYNELENMPEIIDSLSSSIEELYLSKNFVGDISQINFGKFRNLQRIELRDTSLQFADKNPFERNTKLRYLDISNNNLTTWNLSTVSKCALNELNFSFNKLTTLNFTKFTTSLSHINVENNNLAELINFDKSKLPELSRLNIANNNFPCEYLLQLLERIKIKWPKLKLIGNLYQQKHGENCHQEATSKWFYFMTIVTPLVTLVVVIGFVVYRQYFQKTTANDYEDVTYKVQQVEVPTTATRGESECEHHIYEEMKPTTNIEQYDRLIFIGHPKPESDDAGYQSVNSLN